MLKLVGEKGWLKMTVKVHPDKGGKAPVAGEGQSWGGTNIDPTY